MKAYFIIILIIRNLFALKMQKFQWRIWIGMLLLQKKVFYGFSPRDTGQLMQFSVDSFDKDTLSVRFTASVSDFHTKRVDNVFYQNGILCFVDAEQDLYVYDISRWSKIYIRNLSSLVRRNGRIAGIVPFNEGIIIAFQTNGMV